MFMEELQTTFFRFSFNSIRTCWDGEGGGGGRATPLRFLEYNSETTEDFFLKLSDFSKKYIGDVLKANLER